MPPRKASVRAAKSGGHLFYKGGRVSLSRRAFIKRQRCIATGCKTGEWVTAQPWMPPSLKALCPYRARIVVAHVDSRGSGAPDESNILPCEWYVHAWAGQIGWPTFRRKLGLMPIHELAQMFEARYQAANANAQNRKGDFPC